MLSATLYEVRRSHLPEGLAHDVIRMVRFEREAKVLTWLKMGKVTIAA